MTTSTTANKSATSTPSQHGKLFPQPFDPAGSVCVVTGGANGIGRALCMELAHGGGARCVVVVDMDLVRAQQVVDQDLPPGVGIAMQADCGREEDIRRVIRQTEAAVNDDDDGAPCGIDAFFCNAGVLSVGGIDVSNDEWQRIWNINVMQSIYVARHLIPRYRQQQQPQEKTKNNRRGALLVITASAAGCLSMPGAFPYAVTKHAALAVAEWLAYTYRREGIQVACLCPEAVQTNMIGDTGDAGPAGLNGILQPEVVAKDTLNAVRQGRFLVLPHRRVAKHMVAKATDYDLWLKQMGKIHAMFGEEMMRSGQPRRRPRARL